MDKATRKSALDKKIPRDTTLDEQFQEKDAANGDMSEPMPAQESGGPMGGDPKAMVGELAMALEVLAQGLDPESQNIVAQALALLQQVAAPNSGVPTEESGPAPDGENYSNQMGGVPARAGM